MMMLDGEYDHPLLYNHHYQNINRSIGSSMGRGSQAAKMPPLGAGKTYKTGNQNKKEFYANAGGDFGEFGESI